MKRIMDNLQGLWSVITDPLCCAVLIMYLLLGCMIFSFVVEGIHRLLN